MAGTKNPIAAAVGAMIDAVIEHSVSIRNLWTATLFHRNEIADLKKRVAGLEALVHKKPGEA